MKHRLCLASVVLLLAAGPGVAAAAPAGSYDVTCTVGVQTIVNWTHAKVTGITFTWLAPAGTGVTFQQMVVPVTTKAPHGFAVVTTASSVNGVSPVSVVLSVERTRGGPDPAEATCA